MKHLTILYIFLLSFFAVQGQEILQNKMNTSNIKTVLMYVGDDELSLPVWDLGTEKPLTLSFDDLDADVKNYYYRLVHCNADWSPSGLDPYEYLEGFNENQLSDYQSSFNTTVNYTHYRLQIPNDNLRPVKSGNYVIQIYEGSNPDKEIFNKRFMVVERKTEISGLSRNMNQGSYFYNDQELEITVNYFENDFYDISQNLKVQVLKNRNWQESLEFSMPDVIKGNEFIFNNFTKLKFKGGNEFHHFNTKDIYHYLENIKDISYIDNTYHFLLSENTDRTFQEYIYKPDINGLFKTDVSGSDYPESEADYCYVYFTLNMEAPMQQGDIYVWGALTNYEFTDDYKMKYNFEQKAYELRLLLKQGYYNYQYVLMENGKPDFTYIEGNHAQTENLYTVLVYYHDYRGNYDRLIGVHEFASQQY